MQTFLPYPDYVESARVLDMRRLNKQIVEADQILKILDGDATALRGWQHHPAVRMWEQYPDELRRYRNVMFYEWRSRGYTSHKEIKGMGIGGLWKPWWLGDALFHKVHRQNLTRKKPEWYGQFWTEEPVEGYIWPGTTIPGTWKDKRIFS